jgi:hypothetical protein
MASYDRSGRMGYEEFNVAPTAGWADPLHVYFGSSIGSLGEDSPVLDPCRQSLQ